MAIRNPVRGMRLTMDDDTIAERAAAEVIADDNEAESHDAASI